MPNVSKRKSTYNVDIPLYGGQTTTQLKTQTGVYMTVIIMIILLLLSIIEWVYEIRNETEEDRAKKMWLFDHGLY